MRKPPSASGMPCLVIWLGRALLLGMLFECSGIAQEPRDEKEGFLPLPRWSEQEMRAFRENLPLAVHAGDLLPKNDGGATGLDELLRVPLESGPRLEHFFESPVNGLSPRLQAEDMGLFLPEATLSRLTQSSVQDPGRVPTPLSSVKEVLPEFVMVSERALPKAYLIDPCMLVPEVQSQDILRFLEFHARDARIKLHIIILPHDRKLPVDLDLEKIASGGLLQSESCLLVYPLGEPWRARQFISRTVHERTSPRFLTETVAACLQEALQASDVHDQLHRYAVHLSTRLFWLQRSLQPVGDKESAPSLAEFLPETPSVARALPGGSDVMLPYIGVILFLAVTWWVRHVHRRDQRRQQKTVWLLPESETIPRLGGAFTGGGGGVIHYS